MIFHIWQNTVIYFVPHTKSSVAYNCCTDCIVKNPTATIFTSLYSDCVEIMSLRQAMSINQTNKKKEQTSTLMEIQWLGDQRRSR